MNSQQKAFHEINKILMETLCIALRYLSHHDQCFKKYCLQTAAWDCYEKLEKLVPKLSAPFSKPVDACVSACAAAKKLMPEININYAGFPAAAENIIRLAEHIDQLLAADPSLKEGISENNLASGEMFTNLAKLAAQV